MSALVEGNKQYRAVTIMRLDWDTFRGEQITDELNIRRQSTLVMFKGGKEIDRLIAQTSTGAIEAMFVKAIADS